MVTPTLPNPGSMPEVYRVAPPSMAAARSLSATPGPADSGNSSGTYDVLTTFLPRRSMRSRSSMTPSGRRSLLAV